VMFKFCPECGTKDGVQKLNNTDYECKVCQWHFWNNPKTSANVVCVNDEGLILFAKRSIEPKKGLYGIPGGFLQYDEDAYKAAERELFEESGVRVKNLQLLRGIGNNEYRPGEISTCNLHFIATEWEGEFVPKDDVAEFEWKPIEFFDSDQFAWSYPLGLITQLKAFIATMKNDAKLP
jgi:NAD+ diphosphatase